MEDFWPFIVIGIMHFDGGLNIRILNGAFTGPDSVLYLPLCIIAARAKILGLGPCQAYQFLPYG